MFIILLLLCTPLHEIGSSRSAFAAFGGSCTPGTCSRVPPISHVLASVLVPIPAVVLEYDQLLEFYCPMTSEQYMMARHVKRGFGCTYFV